jgi:uncharacterized phage protein (TIGR02218 family)
MKSVSTALAAHAAGETTTFARLWKLTRRDGMVLRFTDHDRDITLPSSDPDAGTYQAATGFSAADNRTRAQLAVDTLEVEALLDSAALNEADLEAGVYDGATVRMLRVNWADPSAGTEILRTGVLGRVRKENGRFVAEVRGLMQRLQNNIGRIVTPNCDVRELGDARCGVNLAPLSSTASVIAIPSEQTATTVFEVQTTRPAGWWDGGICEFASGANAGRKIEIRDVASYDGGLLTDAQATEFSGNGWSSQDLTVTNDGTDNSRAETATATTLRESASLIQPWLSRSLGALSGGVVRFMFSVEVRPVGVRHFRMRLETGFGHQPQRTFNLSTATDAGGTSDGSYTSFQTLAVRCTALPNGYVRCQWLFQALGHTVTNTLRLVLLSSSFAEVYTGVSGEGMDIWGARIVISTTVQELTAYRSEVVTLAVPAAYAISAGDAMTLRPGCNRTRAHCRDKFANIVNFRGFPDVPGIDRTVRGV